MGNIKHWINMKRWMLVPAAMMLLVVGCQSEKWQTAEERDPFPPDDDTRAFRRVLIAQAAASARLDGTLHEYHFEGNGLNSLGESKLDLMLKDNSREWPIVVYLDVQEAKLLKPRQTAVAAFLRDAGLLEAQVRFEVGPNPKVTSPAAPNLARLNKTESESGVASSSSVDKAAAPPEPGK